jgi:lipooligosaccharide transport system permease protein
MAHAAPVYAFAVRQEIDGGFAMLFRFVILPMFLFSGTFFPVDQLPSWLEPVAWVTPLWHAVDLCRSLALGTATPVAASGHVAYLLLWVAVGLWLAVRSFRRRLVV